MPTPKRVTHWHTLSVAQGNAVRPVVIEPARGLIYDRHGVLLVDNEPTYTLLVTPRYFDRNQLPTLLTS
jgi:penicillin-binding protein 2